MDGKNNKKDQDEYLEDLERAKALYKKALSLIDSDLETSANRIYLAFENISYALLKCRHSQVSKKHAKVWERMNKLYLQGLLSFNPKPFLIKAYKFHLFVDYGRKEFQKEKINFNKKEIRELLQSLEKLILEVEKTIKTSN